MDLRIWKGPSGPVTPAPAYGRIEPYDQIAVGMGFGLCLTVVCNGSEGTPRVRSVPLNALLADGDVDGALHVGHRIDVVGPPAPRRELGDGGGGAGRNFRWAKKNYKPTKTTNKNYAEGLTCGISAHLAVDLVQKKRTNQGAC